MSFRTNEEWERFWFLAGVPEVAGAYAALADTPKLEDLEKSYESPMEQSEFRRQLLEEIQTACKAVAKRAGGSRFKETRDLAEGILRLIENSYVEL